MQVQVEADTPAARPTICIVVPEGLELGQYFSDEGLDYR